MSTRLTAMDIEKQDFTRKMRGFDPDEVGEDGRTVSGPLPLRPRKLKIPHDPEDHVVGVGERSPLRLLEHVDRDEPLACEDGWTLFDGKPLEALSQFDQLEGLQICDRTLRPVMSRHPQELTDLLHR